MSEQKSSIIVQDSNSARPEILLAQTKLDLSIDISTLIWMVITGIATWVLTYWYFSRTLNNAKVGRTRDLYAAYDTAKKNALKSADEQDLINNVIVILDQAKDYYYDMRNNLILQGDFLSFIEEFATDIAQQNIQGLPYANIQAVIDHIENNDFYFAPATRRDFQNFIIELRGQRTNDQINRVLENHFPRKIRLS